MQIPIYRDKEAVKVLEKTHKAPNTAELHPRKHPGPAKLAKLLEDIAQKRPHPSSPPSPWLPSGMTKAPPGGLGHATSKLYKELRSLLQVADSSYSSESSLCTCELGLDTDKPAKSALATKRKPGAPLP